jgi:hypothetical protein
MIRKGCLFHEDVVSMFGGYLAAHRSSSNKGDVQQGNNKRNAARAGKVNIELQVPGWCSRSLALVRLAIHQ